MGKIKRQPRAGPKPTNSQHSTKTDAKVIKRRQHSQVRRLNSHGKHSSAKTKGRLAGSQPPPPKPKIPFSKYDRILLVGEGDFSFALSLATHHEVSSIVATSFDDEDTLRRKHPDISSTLSRLQGTRLDIEKHQTKDDDDEWEGFSDDNDDANTRDCTNEIPWTDTDCQITVLHGIDATKLSTSHRKLLNPHAPFTKIVFNFPHTGGLSTDVNRQVRANQELLVAFFNAAKPLLATHTRPAQDIDIIIDDDTTTGDEVQGEEERKETTLRTGRILVTLFESEPYTLWNIRDLARHCGLQVVESFRFPWAAYPGYKHARTIGEVTTGRDRSDEGVRKGAWRGEERAARCYVIALKDENAMTSTRVGRKRGKGSDSDESE